jgi:hypothetical protein
LIISVDIIGLERIDILVSERKAVVRSCGITIEINVLPKERRQILVVAKEGTTIPLHTTITILVLHNVKESEQDMLFEPGDS